MAILLSLLFITISLSSADSARLLVQVDPHPFVLVNPPATLGPPLGPTTIIPPNGSGPQPQLLISPYVVPGPSVTSPNGLGPQSLVFVGPPIVAGPKTSPIGPGPSNPPQGPPSSSLSFFMHDILGGAHPSARVVTGIVRTPDTTGLPFSKPNNNVFPLPGGVPLVTGNNHLTAQTDAVLQNTANNKKLNGGNNQPFVTAGHLPSGATLRHVVFGSVTTIDDELTEGQELGSAVIGRAQGFYFASSLDGTSQTIALTVMIFDGEGDGDDRRHQRVVEDTVSFFGVHRTAAVESRIAVVGGTGKYEKARGYATIENPRDRENLHVTDGADTIVHFSVYLSE